MTVEERSIEEAHLAQADRHIAKAEENVARQTALIKELSTNGHDTMDAQRWLHTLSETLQLMHAHRQLILSRLRNDTHQPFIRL